MDARVTTLATILTVLVSLGAILSAIVHGAVKVCRVVRRQIEAIDANTKALHQLVQRVDALERPRLAAVAAHRLHER